MHPIARWQNRATWVEAARRSRAADGIPQCGRPALNEQVPGIPSAARQATGDGGQDRRDRESVLGATGPGSLGDETDDEWTLAIRLGRTPVT